MKQNTTVISIVAWMAKIIASIIMLQTLFCKFTASEESIYIFTKLGMEPFGRIATGTGELIASVLLLIRATAIVEAFLTACLMFGVIFFHFTVIGIEVMDEGDLLFFYALIILSCSLIIIFMHKNKINKVLRTLFMKHVC